MLISRFNRFAEERDDLFFEFVIFGNDHCFSEDWPFIEVLNTRTTNSTDKCENRNDKSSIWDYYIDSVVCPHLSNPMGMVFESMGVNG